MDYKNTIKETEDKLNVYFQNIDDEVKNSANIVHGIVSKVIDLAKSLSQNYPPVDNNTAS